MRPPLMSTRAFSLFAATSLLASSVAQAQTPAPVVEEGMRKEVLSKEKAGKPDGVTKSLSIGSTAAFNHTSKVVGAPDGATVQIGVVLDGALEWVKGQFEWGNTLKVQHTQTRTPQVPLFVKSADLADLISTAIWRTKALPWFGPYAKFRAQTQLFAGYAVNADDRQVQKLDSAGNKLGDPYTAKKLTAVSLTSPFEPLLLTETVGAFANPWEDKVFTFKAKVGAGAQHVVASKGFAVADNKDTPELEIKQIQAATQIGAEGELALNGEISEQVAWRAKASVFVPALSSVDASQAGIDAMTTDLSAGLSVKLAKWLSADYVITARRVPLVLNDWQIQNGLMLTAGFKL